MSSRILLILFTCLCILRASNAAAISGSHQNTTNIKAHKGMEDDDSTPELTKGAEVMSTAAGGDDDVVMETSAIKLPLNKHVKKQTDRLVRTKLRAARAAEEQPSEADTGANENVHQKDVLSCLSEKSNNTIPAARITGSGHRPFAHSSHETTNPEPYGYQQRWKCCSTSNSAHNSATAFVDGGMIFNQTDKTLRVPTCGYYHITSQIYYHFEDDLPEHHRSVSHLLKYERNCSTWHEYNPVIIKAYSSVTQGDTTTQTSDVIHLCTGGKIWVEIPDLDSKVPCCPMGDDQATFLAAYLIAETSCVWPPDITVKNLSDSPDQ